LPKALFGRKLSKCYWMHLYKFLELRRKKGVTASFLAIRDSKETIDISKDKSEPKDVYNILINLC